MPPTGEIRKTQTVLSAKSLEGRSIRSNVSAQVKRKRNPQNIINRCFSHASHISVVKGRILYLKFQGNWKR